MARKLTVPLNSYVDNRESYTRNSGELIEPKMNSLRDYYGPGQEERALICSIRVQIDGTRSEFLNVLEGDDPDAVVRTFSRKFNLNHSSTSDLLKQVKNQYFY